MSLKDEILSSEDREILEIQTPEWKCKRVWVRSLSVREEIAREAALKDVTDTEQITSINLSYWLCEENGDVLGFTTDELCRFGARNSRVIERIARAGLGLNRFLSAAAIETEKGN